MINWVSSADSFAALMESLENQYEKGHVEGLMRQMAALVRERHEVSHALGFILLFAKVVLEVDGPAIQLKTICESAKGMAAGESEVLRLNRLYDLWQMTETASADQLRATYDKYIQDYPTCPHARVLWAKHLFLRLQLSVEATLRLREAILLRPEYGRAWQLQGLIQLADGKELEAAASLRKCFEIDPSAVLAPAFRESLRRLSESKRAGKLFSQPA